MRSPGAIAYVDPNFKMPQVWRSNVNAEYSVTLWILCLSVGAMYTRDIYNVVSEEYERGRALLEPIMNNRDVYIGLKNNYYDNPKTKTVIQLTNGDEKGYQYSFNASIDKEI